MDYESMSTEEGANPNSVIDLESSASVYVFLNFLVQSLIPSLRERRGSPRESGREHNAL